MGKKVIRLTENDLKQIVNKVTEQLDAVNFAKDAIMHGLFKLPGTSQSSVTPDDNEEGTVIDKAKEAGVSSGQWTRNQSTSPQIQLWYKKSQSDRKSTALVQVNTPKNIKKTSGTWSIQNDKLIIKD